MARAKASLRRVPAQARSRERLERILDAGELELAEIGYDAATMQSIAERAGTSIGSVYQFFPNKKALFDALAARYHAKVRGFFEGLLAGEAIARPWPELIDAAIDGFWRFNTDEPGFRAVWIQGSISPELLDAGEALNREFATRIEAALAFYAPDLPKKQRSVVATVVVETISAMLFVAGRRGEPSASRLMQETKVLVKRYLAGYAAGST
jgi:AcrR family transcriptional regulator